jgi:hypothetical protein
VKADGSSVDERVEFEYNVSVVEFAMVSVMKASNKIK